MTPIITIGRMTVLETSRKKLLLALFALTLVVILASSYGFYRLANYAPPGGQTLAQAQGEVALKTVLSQLLVLVMFMFSFVLALSAVFITAPAIGGEIESGVALAILTRPVSRTEVVVGKWLGLGAVLLAYVAGASFLEFWLVDLGTGYFPPHPFAFIGYLFGETAVILTVGLLASSRLQGMTAGIVGLGAYAVGWIGGIAYDAGTALQNPTIATIGSWTRLIIPSDGLWRGAIYSLEPTLVIAAATRGPRGLSNNPFFSATPPPVPYVLWAAGWLIAVLALTAASLRFREI